MNFRLLPGDTRDQVVERTRALVADATRNGKFELHALPGACRGLQGRAHRLRAVRP